MSIAVYQVPFFYPSHAACTRPCPNLVISTPAFFSCECPVGYEGPRCELIDIGFSGDGYAWYPTLAACEKGHISLELEAATDNGLVFYVGPQSMSNSMTKVQDFMSLEVSEGYAKLLIDYGSGTSKLEQKQVKLSDGQRHHVDIKWNTDVS